MTHTIIISRFWHVKCPCTTTPAIELLRTLPGVGFILAVRLMAAVRLLRAPSAQRASDPSAHIAPPQALLTTASVGFGLGVLTGLFGVGVMQKAIRITAGDLSQPLAEIHLRVTVVDEP